MNTTFQDVRGEIIALISLYIGFYKNNVGRMVNSEYAVVVWAYDQRLIDDGEMIALLPAARQTRENLCEHHGITNAATRR